MPAPSTSARTTGAAPLAEHRRVTIGLAALVLFIGLAGVSSAAARLSTARLSTVPAAAVRDGGGNQQSALPAGRRRIAGNPVSVQIPSIGVDAPLDRLGLTAGGALDVPPFDRAGWFDGGPKPGEIGPAVIAAHVDSTTGPAVFYRLKSLRPGDTVRVAYDDATTVDFVVTREDRYPKSEFPTAGVYGPTAGAELRLITCGGQFDRRAGSYLDNVVVWATATPHAPSTRS
ncbi:MAG: class F sortase [Actinomycetota bacterium]|nr:class F sortase [Actinomycetota bacterium]